MILSSQTEGEIRVTLFFRKIAHAVYVPDPFRAVSFAFSLCLSLSLCGAVCADDTDLMQPSEFRTFTDKNGQQIEARIISVSGDQRQLNLERRDGRTFDLVITLLSLDDQQFLNEWLHPAKFSIRPGPVKGFGALSNGKPIATDALEGVHDIVSMHASKRGWLVRRSSGEIISFEDCYPKIADAEYLHVNTVWIYGCQADGTISGAGGGSYFEDIITNAVQCVGGNAHAAVLLSDGTVKVWGRAYDTKEPIDAPTSLADIVALSSTQARVTAIDRAGRVYSWAAAEPEVFEATLGDGAVQIEGGIFYNIALTNSGEVYTWRRADVSDAEIPDPLKGEGAFQKVRCNGATFAAQREDGSWIAWGRNSSGIVDHINALGPVADIAFFSEPGSQELGYVIWR